MQSSSIPPNPPPDVQSTAHVPGVDPTIDRQLARLYGESLFGAWLDPARAVSFRQRRRGSFGKRLGIALLLLLLVGAGVWLTRRGLSRRAHEARVDVAHDVASFLAEGELDRVAQFLSLLKPPSEPLQATDPHLDLIVRAEAALYRYQDASPARLSLISPYLGADSSAPERLLAKLTVASRTERAAARVALEGLVSALDKEPAVPTLMATVSEQKHDWQAARKNWERSFQVGPLWLPHRYQQCWFEARQHNANGVDSIAAHLAKVAPDSPWTRLVFDHFPNSAKRPTVTGNIKPLPPVAEYHDQVVIALGRAKENDLPAARQALGKALAAVHDQAAFVLDAFDWLLDAKAMALAKELTAFEAWPRNNNWAAEKLKALEAMEATATQPVAPTPSSGPQVGEKTKTPRKKLGAAKKRQGSRSAAQRNRSRR
jgi:hypothetical protein